MLKFTHDLQVLRSSLTTVCETRGGDFSEVLKQSLELLPIEQADLAKEFETARSTVSRWARGQATPSPYLRKEIAEYLLRATDRQIKLIERHLDTVVVVITQTVGHLRSDVGMIQKLCSEAEKLDHHAISEADFSEQLKTTCASLQQEVEKDADNLDSLIHCGTPIPLGQPHAA